MEVMLPTLDWVLGGLLHQVGSSEGGGVPPLSEWGSGERSLFLLYETELLQVGSIAPTSLLRVGMSAA